MRFKLLLVLFLVGTVTADETSDAIKELSNTYAKLDGFIATYRSDGDGKTLDVTMAIDEPSALGLIHILATQGDKTLKSSQWNTEDDQLFLDVGEKGRLCISGVKTEFDCFYELFSRMSATPGIAKKIQGTPSFRLNRTTINSGLKMIDRDTPPWLEDLKNATVSNSDDESVTFLTPDSGLIKISRANGMIVRQSIQGTEEERILDLMKIQLNPGVEKVRRISADWSREGFQPASRRAITQPLRLQIFQALIDGVELGKLKPEVMAKAFVEKRDALRRFTEGDAPPSTPRTDEAFKNMIANIRKRAETEWTKLPADKKPAKFDDFLADKKLRDSIRDASAAQLNEHRPDQRSESLQWMFGKPGGGLTATNEVGEIARKLIEDEINKAYTSSILEREMTKYWGKPAEP